MKQRKLRGYVLPTVYVLVLILIFGTVSVITTLLKSNPEYLYSVGILRSDASIPVINTDGSATRGIEKPFVGESVGIEKYFYDAKDDAKKQEQALIYYENTYMKNTGVLYTAPKTFQVVAVLSGTILNVKEDEVLGNLIEIEHNPNLRTIYYSLDKVDVKPGDVITQGEAIGTSGINKITNNKYSLLFEVYYNGTIMNPLDFYNMDAADLT